MDDLTRKSGYYSDSEKYDFTDNLSLIASEMESDCTFITLEGITDPSGNVRQVPNAPDEVMDMLAQAHVDMVALGWNKAYERGASGAAATLAEARKRGLSTIGLYDSQQDAQQLRHKRISFTRFHKTTTLETIRISKIKLLYMTNQNAKKAISQTGHRRWQQAQCQEL